MISCGGIIINITSIAIITIITTIIVNVIVITIVNIVVIPMLLLYRKPVDKQLYSGILIEFFGTLYISSYKELRTHTSGRRQLSEEEHKGKLVRTDSETNQIFAMFDIVTTIITIVIIIIIVLLWFFFLL